MWHNLREDIAGHFALLDGCGLPTMMDTDGKRRAVGFGIWNPEKELEAKRLFQREYEKRPARKAALAAWRANNKDKINASERARRAKRNEAKKAISG